ncbi:Fe transport protein 3 [Trematosphaeria pertusa]|uniref:Fe transport protein 3 n=1 Tax=Trematosphaeria pertusa TaxID=390896 RepID=A0A6A6IRW0_9PLEO|nr:Fe transport protein 3 [Trematosphaeria pertusa]KAF2253275.1 Fe transport protein 3 [Trematosphaeria pertusa]
MTKAILGLSWTDIPTHLLRAELLRRQDDGRPTCGTKGGRGSYNTPIHVFALILILAVSTAACSFPIVAKRFPKLPVPHQFLFISRHFGTGVLIATAFVHLLPTAFESLTDPCLPRFWNEGYSPMPGLIAMISVFVVVGIEMFFASKGAGHVHAVDYEAFSMDEHGSHTHLRPGHKRSNSFGRFRVNGHVPDIVLQDMAESSENLIAGRSPSIADEVRLLSRPAARKDPHRVSSPYADQTPEMTEAQRKKQLLQCLLLEAGILFHSVFIGMALSVATGTSFIVLLVAISFHQTFEGFALGSRIAAIQFPRSSPRPWLMALAYGTTTPIGQAIGLGIHNLYDPASQTGLLMVGFMNAISSGVVAGAALMALVGAWA